MTIMIMRWLWLYMIVHVPEFECARGLCLIEAICHFDLSFYFCRKRQLLGLKYEKIWNVMQAIVGLGQLIMLKFLLLNILGKRNVNRFSFGLCCFFLSISLRTDSDTGISKWSDAGEKPKYKYNNTGPVLGVVGGSYSSVSEQVTMMMMMFPQWQYL